MRAPREGRADIVAAVKPRAMGATAATILALAASPGHPSVARAGGLDDDRVNARAVARAGAVAVSDDGGAALMSTPAGLARRTVPRVSVGIAVRDFDGRIPSSSRGRIELDRIFGGGGMMHTYEDDFFGFDTQSRNASSMAARRVRMAWGYSERR